jgi:hypothetical protein
MAINGKSQNDHLTFGFISRWALFSFFMVVGAELKQFFSSMLK